MTELVWEGKYVNGKKVAPVRIALPFQDVETVNESAQDRQLSLMGWAASKAPAWRNRLIWGDKKYVLPSLLPDFAGKVNLVYIDPPFATGADFSFTATIPDDPDGDDGGATFTKPPSMIEQKAYRDTWGRGLDGYLQWFYETVVLLHELLAEDGSMYVHLDWHVGHYAKAVLDEVFGPDNFQSEIVWKRTAAHNDTRGIGNVTDMLFLYTVSEKAVWNPQYTPFTADYIDSFYRFTEPDGRRYRLHQIERNPAIGIRPNLVYEYKNYTPKFGWMVEKEKLREFDRKGMLVWSKNGKPQRKIYLNEEQGKPITNMWDDIPPVQSQSRERVGYATQKPEALLERIIQASSNEGDLVLDCFCVRRGTRVLVAEGTPLSPPADGGRPDAPTPAPSAGRAGEGSPALAIEQLRAGDLVLGHDGQPHRVLRAVSRRYRGAMFGLRREGSDQTLWLTADHRVLCRRRVQAVSQHGRWTDIPPDHFERARELRRDMTPPERQLWQRLRGEQLGVKFRRQHPIGPYIADFYARQAGLVVEIDGVAAHSGPQAAAHDQARDAYMRELGLTVLRIPAVDWRECPDDVLTAIYRACAEHTLPDQPDQQWRYAEHIQVGDVVYVGPDLYPAAVTAILCEETDEDVYDIEVEDAHTYLTEICAVHNCGSGTTAAVAERLGRRWITADLGRFAIHTARKRLLSLPDVRPFVVQNLGKYERQAWQAAEFGDPDRAAAAQARYRRFILDLYGAQPIDGYAWLHGVRAGRLVHVGSVDAPVLAGDVRAIAQEFWKAVGKGSGAQTNGVDVLGWDFAFEMNELGKQMAADANIAMSFKRIPREVLEKKAVEQGDIRFFELAALDVDVRAGGKRAAQVDLKDFCVPPDDAPKDVQAAISHWSQWIDYWAIDWDHKGDTFHNQWQSYRARKDKKLQLTATHTYDAPGPYTIVVKVIDILGNDTTKSVTIEVK